MSETIGRRIWRLMEARGLDAVDLCARLRPFGCDLTYGAVQSWRTKGCSPRAEAIPAIARALGVGVADLYDDDGEPALAAGA